MQVDPTSSPAFPSPASNLRILHPFAPPPAPRRQNRFFQRRECAVAGTHRNVHYGIGLNGHGVAQATLVGERVVQRILGKKHPQAGALARRLLRWPPEPLRWVGAVPIHRALALVETRTNRQVRRQRKSAG